MYGVNHIHYDFGDAYSKCSLLLHTLRNLINNDATWFDILRNLQIDFKYKSITTSDLMNYINNQSGQDFTYLFDEYLYQVELPRLEIRIKEAKNKLSIDYRWQNAKANNLPCLLK